MNSDVLQVGVSIDQITKHYEKSSKAILENFSLEIQPGELLAILGPSGGGKSTLLNVLAGLEPITDGQLRFGDRDVTDIPAEQRNVAVVFQSSMLYPHLTLRQSISFAVKLQKIPQPEIERRINEVSDWLRITHLLERKPNQVSGGERQRAAVAKALVTQPALLLMDEPFSAVDAQLRREMRTELVKLHRAFGTTTVFITHDQEEAMGIADRVAVLRNGELIQVAEPLTLYREPATAWLAAFVSMQPLNLLQVTPHPSTPALMAFEGRLTLEPPNGARLEPFQLGVRPEHLHLMPTASSTFRVVTREFIAGQVKYTAQNETGDELVAVASDETIIEIDSPVDVSVDWQNALAFDPGTGKRMDTNFN